MHTLRQSRSVSSSLLGFCTTLFHCKANCLLLFPINGLIYFSFLIEVGCIPIINDMNKLKLVWDMVILLLAVLTSFSVGFEFVIKSLEDLVWYSVFSLASDFIFLIDVFV